MSMAPPPPPPPPPSGPVSGLAGYPAQATVETPPTIARWRPLVQWLLAIPHFVVNYVLSIVGQVAAVIAWFAIVFTGKLPAGLANFICMTLRYSMRVSAYAGFLHETYPPFAFDTTAADPGGHPVRLDFEPQLEGRNRLTVGLRFLWVIPAAIMFLIVVIVGAVCWILGFFAVLFTGKWPSGLHGWVVKVIQGGARLNAYSYLLTDQYPPNPFN